MVKSIIKSDFRLSNLVKGLSEYPEVPPKRDYTRRNIIGKDKNNYHRQYYHEVLAQPKPEEVKPKEPIPVEIILRRTNGQSLTPNQRFCPECGHKLKFTSPQNWSCVNMECKITQIIFGQGRKSIRRIVYASII